MKKCRYIYLMLMIFISGPEAAAQSELSGSQPTGTAIFMEALSYASSDPAKARLEVYVQIPYEQLRFLKEDEIYVALFDLTVAVTTNDGEPVWNQVKTIEIRTENFNETTSNKLSSLRRMTFDMEPGSYRVKAEVFDIDSKRGASVLRNVVVHDYAAHQLSLSDAMIVSRMTTSGAKRTIVPNISSTIGDEDEGFFVFSEIYLPDGVDSVTLVGTLLNTNKDSVFGVMQREEVTKRPHQAFLKFTRYELAMGIYYLDVKVDVTDSAGRSFTGRTLRTIRVRWSDLPASITDIMKAIDQMRYIAREDELEDMRNAKTEEDRLDRFLTYWKKRDPNPQTDRNELMEEYYWRVEYSDRNFSHYMEGWRTDRGMIYIRFGAPDNVERYPFETGTRPYVVWRYYDLNYEFIFVDETGFGDYRLQYPTTDLLGRIRPNQ